MRVYAWLVVVAFSRASGQEAGSSCTLKDGRSGSCERLSKCPEAIQGLKEGKQPEDCFYENFEPFVCCPRPTSSICNRKCEDYSKYVYVQEISAWTPGSPRVNKSRCGAADAGTIFVIGGKEAGPREFPHMALIGYGDKNDIVWGCGGSLISEWHVLTAAHCGSKGRNPVKWVLLGDLILDTSNDVAEPQLLEVSTMDIHPRYSPGHRYDDIAIIRLKKKAELNEFVRPACLHNSRDIEFNVGIATGWGRTSNDDFALSNKLMKVVLPYRNTTECEKLYNTLRNKDRTRSGYDDNTMLCIGDPKHAKDTCKGDSGGPFQMIRTSPYCMYDIIGVTSFGPSTCGVTTPAVYTRVSEYVPWIESVVWPEHNRGK